MEKVKPIEMWQTTHPREGIPARGFPILENAEHVEVYHATRETGAYNHHCRLIHHGGKFHGMWSNHPRGEGAPGMRVLYSTSGDGRRWTDWRVLFPRPGPVGDFNSRGLAATPGRWLLVNGQLYGTCHLFSTIGFGARGQAKPADINPTRDDLHPSKVKESFAFLARQINPDGSLDPIFALWDHLPEDLAFDVQPAPDISPDILLAIIKELVSEPNDLPTSAYREKDSILSFCRKLGYSAEQIKFRMHYPHAEEGHSLSEPVTFPRRDGSRVLLARDPLGSHRLFASFSKDGGLSWPPARPTNIPDAPSRTTSVVLQDGTVLLIGNQVAPKFEDADRRHYSRDPLTLSISPDGNSFTRVYALRRDAPGLRIGGVGGRGPGFQYPGAIARSGMFHVLYSVGKEDIEFLSVRLDEIQKVISGDKRKG